jgi:hypothetical protein
MTTGTIEAVIHPVGAEATLLSRCFSPAEGDGSSAEWDRTKLTV